MICVPVIFSDKTSGVLLALNKLAPELHFTQFDVSCLQSISSNLAILMRQVSLSLGQIDIRISRSPSYLPGEDGEERETPSPKLSPGKPQTVTEFPHSELDQSMSTLLAKLVQEAGRELHADKMSLFIPQTPSRLKCIVSQDILGLEIPVDTGIVGHTFTSQRRFSIENAKTDPRHYSGVDKLSKNETNSLLSYPIIIQGTNDHPHHLSPVRVVGVVQALNKQNGSGFTEKDAQHMDALCARVADVLSRASDHITNGKLNENPPRSKLADMMRSLSEFASLLNRMEETNYLKNLLRGVACYGTTISDCDDIAVFSIASLQSENHRLGLQLVSEDPTQAQTAAHPLAPLISSSPTHTSVVLDILKTKQIYNVTLTLNPSEAELAGAPHLNILVLPVAYTSNPQLSSHLNGRSVDVIVAIKKKGGTQVGTFSPSQIEGLTALVRLLPPSLTLYAQILDEEASVAKLQSNQLIMSSTLNRLGLMVFVVSSAGEVVMHTRSWQRFLGVHENEMASQTLHDLLGDRSPGFMSDIKECIRSCSPREAKDCKIFSASYPKGISVNYDIHELKDSLQSHGSHSLFRVIISVLSPGEFSLDDSPVAENFLAPQEPNQSADRQAKKRESSFKMKSSPDAHALRSPRQFSSGDAAEVERLFTWEFNVLNIVDAAARRYCVVALLEKDLNLGMLNISRNQLAAFVAEVEKNYRLNPFHNFFHAVGVTHFISMLMRDTQARIHINNDLMYFSMMSSAVVHDVDHPGNTNLFEINSGSELALLYNDIGVLENHHCSTAFRIMRLPGLDIFGQLNVAQRTLARKTIISCIMATDMALHVGLVEQMAARTGQPWIIDTPAEKLFYGKIILHSADLSNPVRPFYLSKEWACRVSEEFNRQGEMEKARGLPVSTFLLTPDTKTLAKNEIYFSGQVVAPMWRSLASLFPTLQHLATQIESNVESWKELLASLE
jgi:hypothetical protein